MPARYYIPQDKIEKFYKFQKRIGKSLQSKYLYWKFIQECFPTLDLKNGSWHTDWDNILSPYIQQGEKDDDTKQY